MKSLAFIDYAIIVAYMVVMLAVGIVFTKKASKSVNHFFLSGRSLPWFLIGISMAATNLSIDTPLAITKYVSQHGIAGVWFFWSNAITMVLAAFLFSKLWRRAKVVTDVELIEVRYSGKSAAFLRIFKGFYFGIMINGFVMGWVFRALIKVVSGVTDWDPMMILAVFTSIVFIYTVMSGFYGVVFTDFIQYIIAVFGSISLAYLSVKHVGGIHEMIKSLNSTFGADAGILNFSPDFNSSGTWMPESVFFVYIFVAWWAYKYSDGGGKHIQRMSAAKNETHSALGTFLFSFCNYALQFWPWIITALCSLIVFGKMADPEMGYPMMMAKVLPHGLLGLMVVTLIGAFMSTIDTHLNLGASYMINDFYRRFIKPGKSEKHYIFMSRIAIAVNLVIAIIFALNISSVGEALKTVLAFASGAGITWILRWFWWRINAWTEISAMISSAVVTIVLKIVKPDMLYSWELLTIISISAVVWVTVTYMTSPVDENVLVKFVKRVRPGSPGWSYIYNKYNIEPSLFLRRAIVNWVAGLIFLFSLNFGIGHLCLAHISQGLSLMAVAIAFGSFILYRLKQEDNQFKIDEAKNIELEGADAAAAVE